MLYELAHTIRRRCPWIWDMVEAMNACAVGLRVGRRMGRLMEFCPTGFRLATVADAGALAAFFARQPEESFRWFRPHAFDEAVLRKLLARKSYVMYVAAEESTVIGYGFLYCFANGKCFLGAMVDAGHRRQGVCTRLYAVGVEMAAALGFRPFWSVNKENLGSMKAVRSAADIVWQQEMENGDILMEGRKR